MMTLAQALPPYAWAWPIILPAQQKLLLLRLAFAGSEPVSIERLSAETGIAAGQALRVLDDLAEAELAFACMTADGLPAYRAIIPCSLGDIGTC